MCTFVAVTNSTEELLPSSRYITSYARNNNTLIHRLYKLNSEIKSNFLGELPAICKAHLPYLREMSSYIVGIHEDGDETSVSFHQPAGRHISGLVSGHSLL